MAAGLSTTKVEIEFTAGAWTDVSSFVQLGAGIQITMGRDTAFSDIQPGTCTFTLDNIPDATTGICPFTPDSALSPYYPNIVEGKRVRVISNKTVDVQRFIGYITAWTPDIGDGVTGSVAVTAVDLMATFERVTLNGGAAEWTKYLNRLNGAVWDYWPLDDDSASTSLRNLNPVGNRATVDLSGDGLGSIQFGPPDGLLTDGMMTLTPSTAAAPTGPILQLTPTGTVKVFQIWFRTTSTAAKMVVGAFYNGATTVFSLQVQSGSLGVYDSAGALYATVKITANDGQWHSAVFVTDVATPTTTNVYFDSEGAIPAAYVLPYDMRTTNRISVGGASASSGLNTYVFDGDISGLGISDGNTFGGYEKRASTRSLVSAQSYFSNELLKYYAYNFTGYTILGGADDRTVARMPLAGVTLASALATLARTVGGTIWFNPRAATYGAVEFRTQAASRSDNVLRTITMGADDVLGQQWRRSTDANPTRMIASSQFGSVESVDTVAEDAGVPRRDESVETTAGSIEATGNVAALTRSASARMQLQSFSVDLVTATADLYTSCMDAMAPGVRLRAGSLPSAMFGVTYTDVYVQGWTETITADAYLVEFRCSPADAPVEGQWDDATRGRFGTETLTTLDSSITSSGTTIVFATGTGPGPTTFTTAAGSYPLDIDLNGERITLNNPPGGSSSPQTFTGVTRGVAPTVARAHVAGEVADVWQAARWTI